MQDANTYDVIVAGGGSAGVATAQIRRGMESGHPACDGKAEDFAAFAWCHRLSSATAARAAIERGRTS